MSFVIYWLGINKSFLMKGGKHQDHLIKGKGKHIYKDRGCADIYGPR